MPAPAGFIRKNMNEIIKPEQFELSIDQASSIQGKLTTIIEERNVYESQFNLLMEQEISPELVKQCGEIRKKIKANRTQGIEVWHKNEKNFFLKGGQFIDALRRREVDHSKWMEDKLESVEKYYERLEQERISKLIEDRTAVLEAYEIDIAGFDLGSMPEDTFQQVAEVAKATWERKQAALEAERKAAELKAEQEAKHVERRELVRDYTMLMTEEEKDQFYGEMPEKAFTAVVKDLKKRHAEHLKEQAAIKAENDRLAAEAKAQAEKLAAAMKERERVEAESAAKEQKLKDELAAAQRLLEEANKKREAEEAAKKKEEEKEKERLAEEARQATLLPVKTAIENYIDSFVAPANIPDHDVARDILKKFEGFKDWAYDQLQQL